MNRRPPAPFRDGRGGPQPPRGLRVAWQRASGRRFEGLAFNQWGAAHLGTIPRIICASRPRPCARKQCDKFEDRNGRRPTRLRLKSAARRRGPQQRRPKSGPQKMSERRRLIKRTSVPAKILRRRKKSTAVGAAEIIGTTADEKTTPRGKVADSAAYDFFLLSSDARRGGPARSPPGRRGFSCSPPLHQIKRIGQADRCFCRVRHARRRSAFAPQLLRAAAAVDTIGDGRNTSKGAGDAAAR